MNRLLLWLSGNKKILNQVCILVIRAEAKAWRTVSCRMGPATDFLCVHGITLWLIGYVDAESADNFFAGYQSMTSLSFGELWSHLIAALERKSL